uniref:Leucine-rich repeat protein n=1 Tax=Paramoeba aestuarina TaxID=180227 RepID=A0A7S4NSP2_9EUKA|mmetsp:Transcript_26730/g.41678  ORF Transcript_26730/g.41678 Transcript_26730/m.41678 type:complete len:220 (+) Transcript_26730:18-677(+)
MNSVTYFMISNVLSQDPSLGRLDKSAFSQQTLLEIFLSSITNTEGIIEDSTEPISTWRNLTFNESGELTRISWEGMNLEGSIELKWLPSTLKFLTLKSNHLSGSLDLTDLPDDTQSLFLLRNAFTGSIDLTRLPDSMLLLDVSGNHLSGCIDVTKLPASLKVLMLHSNDFSGWTDFRAIPETLKILSLCRTNLEGDLVQKVSTQKFSSTNSKVNIIIEE